MSFFNREMVTIHLEEREARAVVFEGARVSRWASAPIPPDVIASGRVEEPRVLGTVLVELLSQVQTQSSRPYISLSGIHPVVRVLQLPHLKKNLLTEAIRGEMGRELPSPLEHYQIHWVELESSKTESTFYVMAVPTNELETYYVAFKEAGLRPKRIVLESGALASLIEGGDNIVIGIKDEGFSIAVIREGTPTAIRDINYSRESLSLGEKMSDLARELQLTLASLGTADPDSATQSAFSTYLVGKYASDPSLTAQLSREAGFDAAQLEIPTTVPQDFPLVEYATNLGISLSKPIKSYPFRATKPNIAFDLNVSRPRLSAAPLARGALFIAVTAALATVISPLLDVTGPQQEEVRLQSRIERSQAGMDDLRQQVRIAREAEAQRVQIAADAQQLDVGLQQIAGQRLIWPTAVLDSRQAFPNIELLSFSEDTRELNITALAPNAADAVAFSQFLSDSPDFRAATIQSLAYQIQDDGERQFRFELSAQKKGQP